MNQLEEYAENLNESAELVCSDMAGKCACDIAGSIELVEHRMPSYRWAGWEESESYSSDDLNNGLSFEDNATLVITPHIDQVIILILRGLRNVLRGKTKLATSKKIGKRHAQSFPLRTCSRYSLVHSDGSKIKHMPALCRWHSIFEPRAWFLTKDHQALQTSRSFVCFLVIPNKGGASTSFVYDRYWSIPYRTDSGKSEQNDEF